MLILPPGQGFSIYALAALPPLLPAKQRRLAPNDWMATDAEVACPDPNCPTRFRIMRTGVSTVRTSPRSICTQAISADPHARSTDGHQVSCVVKGGWRLAGDRGPSIVFRRSRTWPPSSRPR